MSAAAKQPIDLSSTRYDPETIIECVHSEEGKKIYQVADKALHREDHDKLVAAHNIVNTTEDRYTKMDDRQDIFVVVFVVSLIAALILHFIPYSSLIIMALHIGIIVVGIFSYIGACICECITRKLNDQLQEQKSERDRIVTVFKAKYTTLAELKNEEEAIEQLKKSLDIQHDWRELKIGDN